MKRLALLMAAVVTMAVPNSRAGTNTLDQVVLLDVQGLWGGTEPWISEDGQAICRFVSRPKQGESGLQETRYSFALTGEQRKLLADLVEKHAFFEMTVADRFGVPDEARPTLFIRSGGRSHAVHKWANDKHPGFDAIYGALLHIAKAGWDDAKLTRSPFDRAWAPGGFPTAADIAAKLKPTKTP